MKKILIIEDDADIRESLKDILKVLNYIPYTASNGKEGVTEAIRLKPDLIISDIMMPKVDGYAMIDIIKKDPRIKKIPIIFLTAKAQPQDIKKGKDLGAVDYLTKPFKIKDVIAAVKNVIE